MDIDMAKLKLRGKELLALGYPEGKVIGVAINMMLKYYKRSKKSEVLDLLTQVLQAPERYEDHEFLGKIAAELLEPDEELKQEIPLLQETLEFPTFGLDQIEEGALQQMQIAMRLPVTKAGALMPDAHQGYGLPIGGVLAVENAVIPYGVGMDIGCRMCLTVYDLKPAFLEKNRSQLSDMLMENSRFGRGVFDRPFDDEVLTHTAFREIPKVKELRHKAIAQIGSSGSGNHFVEFGRVDITDPENEMGLTPGSYLGILTHSGSRGFGAGIARHYTKIAMEKCLLPKEARHLAWLSLDSEAGQEYWIAMNLAGDYASACHHHIHRRLGTALGAEPLAMVENHHNFAWKETLSDGREMIVHRKGATPAGKGVLGVIPGSMTAPGFIVRGKGSALSLNSASHGAGRLMSRRKAKERISKHQLKKHLRDLGVDLLGGGLDEAPFAYKDIHQVMQHQEKLVDVLGTFLPKVVRMDAG